MRLIQEISETIYNYYYFITNDFKNDQLLKNVQPSHTPLKLKYVDAIEHAQKISEVLSMKFGKKSH